MKNDVEIRRGMIEHARDLGRWGSLMPKPHRVHPLVRYTLAFIFLMFILGLFSGR